MIFKMDDLSTIDCQRDDDCDDCAMWAWIDPQDTTPAGSRRGFCRDRHVPSKIELLALPEYQS